MKFVDRLGETARLKTALSRERTSFVVLYGRRRLGKSTMLIQRVLGDGDVYFLADSSEGRHQRGLLAKVAAEVFADFDKVAYPDWESILREMNHRADRRFTLCLDEFPFLVEQSPELPSVLQKLIDGQNLKYNIVLCGSSQNMMSGLVLDATAPLYGRADEVIRLTPMRLPYIAEALGLGAMEAVEEYAVWGGVPRYWELREPHSSLAEALWHNVFSVNGALYDEPAKLFQDDVKDVVKTSTIMSYVANGANRMSEIAARCGEPATNLSRPLKRLLDLGFLEKDVPFGAEEKNSKKSLYKIADPFMAFYHQFVVPNRSFIELRRRAPVEQALNAHFSQFVSLQWEKLCRNAVSGNTINGVTYGVARRWWGAVSGVANVNVSGEVAQSGSGTTRGEHVELDVVAESLDGKHLLVGECKWTAKEDATALTADLLRKASQLPFAEGHTIVPMLFLKNTPKNPSGNTLLPQDILSLSV